jgi:hypothetical protein
VNETTHNIDILDEAEVRALAKRLLAQARFSQATIEKLTHENAVLKRLKFAAQSERFSAEQQDLLQETLEADLQAVAEEIEQLQPAKPPREGNRARRQVLPAQLPRTEIRHEPESTQCACGCQMQRVGEDVAEKLD